MKRSARVVYMRMGRLLDLEIASEADALRAVMDGLSSRSFLRVEQRRRLEPDAIAPPSARRRRIAAKSRFSRDESERAMRRARVYGEAVELFGDEKAAPAWLKTCRPRRITRAGRRCRTDGKPTSRPVRPSTIAGWTG